MIGLSNVRDWLKTLENKADNYYIGKLDNKTYRSIGVYQRKSSTPPRLCIGGQENNSYNVKQISILIHWNMNARETEEFSMKLYEELLNQKSVSICNHNVRYIKLFNNEPIDVGTDEKGVYERVIELEFYYERNDE